MAAQADQQIEEFIGQDGRAGADDLAAGAGGVGEGAGEVEDGREAQGLADGGDVVHGGVMGGGEGEADIRFFEAVGLLGGGGFGC